MFTAIPIDGVTGGICPIGFYCINGTNFPYPCPLGTYGDQPLLNSEIDCTPCPQGFFCDSYNSTEPSGKCRAGFYCPLGSRSSTEKICQQGMFEN